MSWLAFNRLILLQRDFRNQLEAILAYVKPDANGRQSVWHSADSRISWSYHTVPEWLEQVELVCEMCGVDNVECVLPLRLRGGALSVYRWLTHDQKEDLQQVKQALLVAFAPDLFVTFDIFVLHHLRPGGNCGWIFGWPTGPSTSNQRKHLGPMAQLRFRVRTPRSG